MIRLEQKQYNDMKINIEEYKGQSIQYDEDDDKFVCSITVEDNFKETKRKSLKDVRKEIDQFIKLNMDFKPFKALLTANYDRDYTFKLVDVTAIRTDGKLVVNEGNYIQYFDTKKASKLMKYDKSVIEESQIIDADFEEHRKAYFNKQKEIHAKLVPVDLTRFGLQ